VYLPHPLFALWVNDFIEECAGFPNGTHEDQVDAMTQALLRLTLPSPQPATRYGAATSLDSKWTSRRASWRADVDR